MLFIQPMIQRINYIKHIGVFQNFKRGGNLQDFLDTNIIYGWNYSGKTTLSRIFSYLDKNTVIEDEYANLEFEFELNDKRKIDHTNRANSPVSIKVFNSDFIRNNLHFDTDNKIQSIKFAVGEVANIHLQIEAINQYIQKAKAIIQSNSQYIEAYNDFDNKFFTDIARQISNLFQERNFNKTNVKNIIRQFGKKSLNDYLIPKTEYEQLRSNALSPNVGSTISCSIKPVLRYKELFSATQELLIASPTDSIQDDILSNNSLLYNWVKTGLDIYKNNAEIKTCAFCGADISDGNRVAYLNAFYSNEAARVKESIHGLINNIEQEKDSAKTLSWAHISENDLTINVRDRFNTLKQEYVALCSNYINLLDKLIEALRVKETTSLFVPIQLQQFNLTPYSEFASWIESMRQVLVESNNTITNFESIRTESREKLRKHLVAQFLIDKEYSKCERLKNIEEKGITKLQDAIKIKENDRENLVAQLNSIDKGKDELNRFIQLFLNRKDISIDVTNDKFFILKRGNKEAKHLSEGEKTAIAFSHFMVQLKSLKDNKTLANTIIFFDDPISSLDTNHIAQISSLINSFFYEKGLDADKPDKICLNCKQLFITTHNFELFSFLKDASNIKKRGTKYYMIKKENSETSVIIDIPKSLSKYKSEYVYLFSEIDQFKNEGCPVEKSYIMPNIIRRFVELYTLMKLPGNTDEIDNRIKLLYGNVNELKILHTFSHLTSFERVTKHNELALRMPDIIDDLYKILTKDNQHYTSLLSGIN